MLPPPQKILIINPFGIGDVLFTTPLISNIKAHWPSAGVGYLANARSAPILALNPKIDKVFIYERDEFNAVYRRSKIEFFQKFRKFLEDIHAEQFDLAIDLSLNGNLSFLMWLIGIRKRVGFNYKNRSPLLTQKIPLEGYESKHVVEYYLDILTEIGVPAVRKRLEIFVPEADKRWAESIWHKHGDLVHRKVVAIIPGGGASWGKDAFYKRWPLENYAKLADKIVEKFGAAIILMGDQNETVLCDEVAHLMRRSSVDLAGKTSITQLAALLALCKAVVVNDGGPLHVAVAAGAKTVSIFGPVDEKVYGPYPQENHVVITNGIACRPCYSRFRRAECGHVSCLTKLDVDEVAERIGQIL